MAQQDKPNNSMITDEIILVVFIGFVLVALWGVGHTAFVGLMFSLWGAEMWVMSFFTDKFDTVSNWVGGSNYGTVSFMQFWQIGNIAGTYTRYLWSPLMVLVAIYIYVKNPLGKYSKPMGMNQLVEMFRPEWPFASMFYDEKMQQEKVYKMPFRPLKPREFTRKYKLLDEDGNLDESRAEMVFIRQLGDPFKGTQSWPLHKKALLAMFLLKYERKNDQYKALRNLIATIFTNTKRIVGCEAEVNAAINGVGERGKKLLQKLKRKHAYDSTWFHSLYWESRSGVLAPVEFSWLKVIDNPLWLNLDSMDRRRAWAQSAGVRAHWLAERSHGAGILTPILTEAIIGLREALAEVREPDVEE